MIARLLAFATFISLVVFESCGTTPAQNLNPFTPTVIDFTGYVVPADSLADPEILPAQVPDTVPAKQLPTEPLLPFAFDVLSPFDTAMRVPLNRFEDTSHFHYLTYRVGQDHSDLEFIGGTQSLYWARAMQTDKAGHIWFGTTGGVSCYTPRGDSASGLRYYSANEGLCSNVVDAIRQDRSGKMWFGTGDGKMSCYDGKNFANLNKQDDAILCMTEDQNGNIWSGRFNGVQCYNPATKTTIRWTTAQGLCNNAVQCMLEDKTGKLWFGTFRGVTCYDPKAKRGNNFVHYTKRQGLVNDNINTIYEDSTGNIWFGTEAGGATCFNGKTLMTFTTVQGLANDTVQTIFGDSKGNLWFGTRMGLSKITSATLNDFQNKIDSLDPVKQPLFINYGVSDGISGGFFRNSVCESAAGAIWWGTTAGVLVYSPR
ncbi:MAG TPA: two-component regulator propeller domain-containing protein [Bacteroidia bacterium]|nr:two-component regulator propeller domain-containing protein [Bacteroidia bacterium]